MDGLLNNQIFIGLVLAAPAFTLGFLAYRRSARVDKRNAAAENLDEIFKGNQDLLENYAKDNEKLRIRVRDLEEEVATLKLDRQTEIDRLTTERNDLSHKLLRSQQENAKLIKQMGST